MKRILRLYPGAWRERYREEMESILDERSPGPFEMVDLLLGALDAHLHLRGLGNRTEHRKGTTMSLRIAGYASIVGGALWGLSWLALIILNWSGREDTDALVAASLIAATVALLIALAGLSAFQARTHRALGWASFIIPGLGALLMALGLVLMVLGVGNAWNAMIVGLLALPAGAIVFGVVTYRTEALSRRGSALLAVGAALQLAGIVVIMAVDWSSPLQAIAVVGAASFAAGWLALGTDAVRRDRMPVAGSPTPA
jgi:hypothetical protein